MMSYPTLTNGATVACVTRITVVAALALAAAGALDVLGGRGPRDAPAAGAPARIDTAASPLYPAPMSFEAGSAY
jgi:hypothetical protein